MTTNVVCYGCKYAPIELLAGFGADARLIMAEPQSFEVAERLAHGNLCGFGKSVLACGLDPSVRQMVLTTCCDVMRRAYDVLKAQGVVTGGMLPKIENCLSAVGAGVRRVVITRADTLQEGCGTTIE